MTIPIDIDAARKIVDAATPGPWTIPGANLFRVVAPEAAHNNAGPHPYPWRIISNVDTESYPIEDDGRSAADARFIAAARTLLPDALDEIESLRKQVAERDATIAELRAALAGKDARLARVTGLLRELWSSSPATLRGSVADDIVWILFSADDVIAKTAPKEGT